MNKRKGDTFKGLNCKNGHDGLRYLISGKCVYCKLEADKKYRDKKLKKEKHQENEILVIETKENIIDIEDWFKEKPQKEVKITGRLTCTKLDKLISGKLYLVKLARDGN